MIATQARLPLVPLVLGDVAPSLVRALGQEGIVCRAFRRGAMQGRFVLYDSRRTRRWDVGHGQVAIDVAPLADGCEEDPFAALDDEQSRAARWMLGSLSVEERVARVDKRGVRRRLMGGLRAMIEAAGGVWLRVAAFPYPYRSAFNFRIDHDAFDEADFGATLDALAGWEDATTHFVCAATHAGEREALARLDGLDVGSHGYWHHTYAGAAENAANIIRGIEALRGAGLEPVGFAAPHGRYVPGLAETLVALGVRYSSEFGLAYDELPFHLADGRLIQVPIHPVCLGICLEAAVKSRGNRAEAGALAATLTVEHFAQVARSKYAGGEPLMFYGHPDGRLGRHPQVLRRLLAVVDGFTGVWRTSMTSLAAWWQARSEVRLRVFEQDGGYEIVVDRRPAGYRLGVECLRGDAVGALAVDGAVTRFAIGGLALEHRATEELAGPVRVDRAGGVREALARVLDWERVTPIDQIDVTHWRGWAKRMLRRLKC